MEKLTPTEKLIWEFYKNNDVLNDREAAEKLNLSFGVLRQCKSTAKKKGADFVNNYHNVVKKIENFYKEKPNTSIKEAAMALNLKHGTVSVARGLLLKNKSITRLATRPPIITGKLSFLYSGTSRKIYNRNS